MAITECLARGFTFELNTGTDVSPTWVEVGNIKQFAHNPSANDADTTTFSDGGHNTHLKASRGDEFTLTGLYLEDPSTGDRDPGQEAVEAWGLEIGPPSVKPFRITSPGGNVLTFDATTTVTLGGGGNDDPNAWAATLKVTGAITPS